MLYTSPFFAVNWYQSRSPFFSMRPAISHGSLTCCVFSGVSLSRSSSTTGARAKVSRRGLDQPLSFLTRYSKPSSPEERGATWAGGGGGGGGGRRGSSGAGGGRGGGAGPRVPWAA